MVRKAQKISIIVIVVILLIGIAAGSLAFIYLKTDLLKSDEELFLKYVSQDLEAIKTIADLDLNKEIYEKEQNGAYERKTKISMTNSNNEQNTSENALLNNLSLNINDKKTSEKRNINLKLSYKQEDLFKIDYLQEDDIAGIKLNDIKQYVSIKNENLKQVAQNFGLDIQTISQIPDKLDFQKYKNIITEEQIETLANKYKEIILSTLKNGEYSKQKNGILTINEQKLNVNQYTVTLKKEKIKELYVQILNNLKNDTIIVQQQNVREVISGAIDSLIEEAEEIEFYDVKITVYENLGNTVRTMLEIENKKYILDLVKQENNINLKLQNVVLNNTENQVTIDINKNTNGNHQNTNIQITQSQDGENQKFTMQHNFEKNENNITNVLTFGTSILDNDFQLKIEQTTDFKQNVIFENEFDETNNVLVNNLNSEGIAQLLQILQGNITEQINSKMLYLQNETGDELLDSIVKQQNGMTSTEINRFNSKFEFYSGSEVTAENVKMLLAVVSQNLENVEFVDEDTTRMTIKDGVVNQELANQVAEQIEDRQKYSVQISYDTNNLIQYITIQKIDED